MNSYWLAIAALGSTADALAANSVRIERTEESPTVDGRLDDPAWRDAMPITDFHQQRPDYRMPATEKTEVRVTYDDDNFYIAARLYDREPAKIRATQFIQGKDISADDRFWCTIDTFNSKRNDYYFEVNPNAVRGEALRENNSLFIAEWTTIWDAASRVTGDGWTTELAIPFKSLSFDSRGGVWRINCGRWIMRKQEHVLLESSNRQWWAVDSRELYGVYGVEQGLGIDVSVSATAVHRHEHGTGDSHSELQPSADIYYRVTPSITAAFTLNSDFATTEVDDLQVALDRFALFYPEKRDFFLQDAGIFDFGGLETNGRPFFSRRIGLAENGAALNINAAGKLTGRAGRFSFGGLAVNQEAPTGDGSNSLFVARGTMNVLEESALGFIATHGDPANLADNTLFGADFFYRTRYGPFGGTLQGNAWIQQSRTGEIPDDQIAAGARLEYPNDRVNWWFGYQEIQENFNPALGYLNRRGIRQSDAYFRFRSRPVDSLLQEVDHEIQALLVKGMDGRRQTQVLRLRPLRLNTVDNDSIYLEWQESRELVQQPFVLFGRLAIAPGDYRFDHWRLALETGLQRNLVLAASVQEGSFFGGRREEWATSLQWRPSKYVFVRTAYVWNDVELPSGRFISRLATVQGDFAVNRAWSLGAMVQYDNSAEFLGGTLRVRYAPRDGQEILFVLNNRFDVPEDGGIVSRQLEALLKMSYTFRF